LVNNDLTYGREVIRSSLTTISPFDRVMDIGAGTGTDLSIARRICPGARLYGIECDAKYGAALGLENE
jgi:precorrin-6B methylase 2